MAARLPGVPEAIAGRVCDAVALLRDRDLYKLPGVGETIAWAQALLALGRRGSFARGLGRRGAEGPRGHRARARGRGARGCLSPRSSPTASRCWRPGCAATACGWGWTSCWPAIAPWPRSTRRRAWSRSSPCAWRCARASTTCRCSPTRFDAVFGSGWHDALDLIPPAARACCRASAILARALPPAPSQETKPVPAAWSAGRAAAHEGLRRASDREIAEAHQVLPAACPPRAAAAQPAGAALAPARRPRGHARDDPRVPALRRRARRTALAPGHAAPAPGRARVRRVGLDGAICAHAVAPICRRAWPCAPTWRRSPSAPG